MELLFWYGGWWWGTGFFRYGLGTVEWILFEDVCVLDVCVVSVSVAEVAEACFCGFDMLFWAVLGGFVVGWFCWGACLVELLFCNIEAAVWKVGKRVVFCSWVLVLVLGEGVENLLVILSPWCMERLMCMLF